jgi:CRISPR/Cas system-associated exonuclease Cas4 (RecB family)
MYQLGTKWQLWDLPNYFQKEVSQITLRGYHTEPPVSLPSDFYSPTLKPLSVEKIARAYCPLRRDLYLEKRLGVRNNQNIWGQTAGHLIESYLKNILVVFSELSNEPDGLTYQKIDELSQSYSDTFWQAQERHLKDLEKKASTPWEDPTRLVALLKQTTKYELLMLGTDYHLRQRGTKFVPITQRISLEFSEPNLHIKPNPKLGLSEKTTPDFLIRNPVVVMGEVKSGRSIQPYHLNAVAGYALAYESEHENTNVDFGIVYFFETHNDQMNFAQTYVFIIDDFLRRKFLNERNEVYSLLQGTEPPITQKFRDKHYETLCSKCKFLTNCYPNDR